MAERRDDAAVKSALPRNRAKGARVCSQMRILFAQQRRNIGVGSGLAQQRRVGLERAHRQPSRGEARPRRGPGSISASPYWPTGSPIHASFVKPGGRSGFHEGPDHDEPPLPSTDDDAQAVGRIQKMIGPAGQPFEGLEQLFWTADSLEQRRPFHFESVETGAAANDRNVARALEVEWTALCQRVGRPEQLFQTFEWLSSRPIIFWMRPTACASSSVDGRGGSSSSRPLVETRGPLRFTKLAWMGEPVGQWRRADLVVPRRVASPRLGRRCARSRRDAVAQDPSQPRMVGALLGEEALISERTLRLSRGLAAKPISAAALSRPRPRRNVAAASSA